ncbi:MAG: S8 family serine peptidase [Acidobacteriota bacterium]
MKRKLYVVALLVLALAMQASNGLLGTTRAQVRVRDDGQPARKSQQSTGRARAIVELESAPVAAHERAAVGLPRRSIDFEAPRARAYESRLEGEQQDFMTRAALVSPGIRVRAKLRRLANAVSVEAGASEVAALASLPGVKRVQIAREYHSTLDTSVPLINAPAVWNNAAGPSAKGEGMKIAILDTGIDITNALFSGAGFIAPAGFPRANHGNLVFTNNKVIVAKSFLDESTSAQDEFGHGSNVAGIAAGNSGTVSPLAALSGVAPRAFLGNYRVLDEEGNGFEDQIALALDEALSDGFDVANLSLGGPADDTIGFLDQAVEDAVSGGMIVVCSAGNEGAGGEDDDMTIGSPGIAPSAITVAASSNAHIVGPVITVDQPAPVAETLLKIGSSTGNSVVVGDTLTQVPYAYVDPQRRACGGSQIGSLTGNVALIERGGTKPNGSACGFADKVNAASAAGARAAIIFNKDVSEGADGGESILNMEVSGTTIPSVFIARSAGLALRDFLAANPSALLTIKPLGTGSFTADVLADFSSRGPSTILGLKPDITAPGVIIYSAAITDPNGAVTDPSGFAAVSGTSQAAPHIAGGAALIKQLNPNFTPVQVKSVLMSSALADVFDTVNKTTRVPVLAQGAGRVDLARAAAVKASCSPASVSFGIVKRKNKLTLTAALTFTNVGGNQNTFNLSTLQLDTESPLVVSVSSPAMTLAAGQTGTVELSVFLKKKNKAEKRDYTGYVNVTDSLGLTVHVPYWVRYK